jgi:tetratricopeptide (TPR) repeat protein
VRAWEKNVNAPLEHPENLHLRAALGWLELGNHLEANEELEKISPRNRVHPDVLEMRWAVYSAARKFDACEDIGRALVQLAPDRSNGWRHRSAAIHFLNRSNEAYDLLHPALAKFPKDWPVHYDMACYATTTGRLGKARVFLAMAIELASGAEEAKKIKQLALDDADLEALWTDVPC